MNVQKHKDMFYRDITSLGGLYFALIVLVTTFLLGRIHLSIQLGLAIVLTMGIAVVIRSLYFKERPKKEKHDGFIDKLDASSFPSIHAARSWSLAMILGYNLGSELLWAFFLFLAIKICVSRIKMRKHDIVDIIGGIILGCAIALLILVVV